ncbi:MAG: TraR/DksA C4-type zinc finger protein [Victivallaceae bacterium]|nr:TraR/DksA C4-type zinc finger protein [Victivallaceae bacterium]MDD4180931.1 TraR/DksA C4-type zinc finger protein [Victivallaceae bacterium]
MTKNNDKKKKHSAAFRKKYYNLLMKTREQFVSQMNVRREEALNTADLDKSSISNHIADSANNEMELHLLTQDGNVLELIDLALKRLEDGEYGTCMDCSCDIGDPRLEFRPYSMYCIQCKSIREKNNGINPNVG